VASPTVSGEDRSRFNESGIRYAQAWPVPWRPSAGTDAELGSQCRLPKPTMSLGSVVTKRKLGAPRQQAGRPSFRPPVMQKSLRYFESTASGTGVWAKGPAEGGAFFGLHCKGPGSRPDPPRHEVSDRTVFDFPLSYASVN